MEKQKKTNTYPRRPIRFVSSPKSNVMHGSPFPSEHTMSPLLLRWMVSELSEPMKGTDNPAIYTFQKRRPTTYPILIFPKRQSSPRDSTIHTILHQRRLTVLDVLLAFVDATNVLHNYVAEASSRTLVGGMMMTYLLPPRPYGSGRVNKCGKGKHFVNSRLC